MEYIDVFDEKENLIENHVEREYAHDNGLWHREVLIIVINNKNELLLQQRNYNKRFMPGKWALLGGHITSGETPITTARRELKEEVGLEKCKEELIFIKKYKKADKTNKKFQYIYVALTKNKIEDYKINSKEIRRLKYANLQEIERRINNKDYSLIFTRSPKFHLNLFNEIFDILE